MLLDFVCQLRTLSPVFISDTGCVCDVPDIGVREILASLCLRCGEETCGVKDEALLNLSLVRIRGRNLGYISVDLG